jgi:thioredoxin reductase (NADPH)
LGYKGFFWDQHKVWIQDDKEIHAETMIISTVHRLNILEFLQSNITYKLVVEFRACAVCDDFQKSRSGNR